MEWERESAPSQSLRLSPIVWAALFVQAILALAGCLLQFKLTVQCECFQLSVHFAIGGATVGGWWYLGELFRRAVWRRRVGGRQLCECAAGHCAALRRTCCFSHKQHICSVSAGREKLICARALMQDKQSRTFDPSSVSDCTSALMC